MKVYCKKLVAAALVVCMALGMTACGSKPLDGSQIVATVGEKEMTLGEANFLLRYQQVQTEYYYESLLGEDIYEMDLYGTGNTYDVDFKADVMTQMHEYYAIEEKAADYGVVLTEEETAARIKALYEKTGYVLDTHTAVASHVYEQYVKETGDTTKTVIASTASPFKFGQSVMEAIDGKAHDEDMFELVETLSKTANVVIPNAVEELKTAPVLHDNICEKDGMKDIIKQFLGM